MDLINIFIILFLGVFGFVIAYILFIGDYLSDKRIENSYLKVVVKEIKNGIGEKMYCCNGYQMYKNKILDREFSKDFNTLHDAVSYKQKY